MALARKKSKPTFTDSFAAVFEPRPESFSCPLPAVTWVSRRYRPRCPLLPRADGVEGAGAERVFGDQRAAALLLDTGRIFSSFVSRSM